MTAGTESVSPKTKSKVQAAAIWSSSGCHDSAEEFRSALPFVLYTKELAVEPITLPVGDYILSRDICVERKAFNDWACKTACNLHVGTTSSAQGWENPIASKSFFTNQTCSAICRQSPT
eukprot:6487634-Amphidinium_carterae.1